MMTPRVLASLTRKIGPAKTPRARCQTVPNQTESIAAPAIDVGPSNNAPKETIPSKPCTILLPEFYKLTMTRTRARLGTSHSRRW